MERGAGGGEGAAGGGGGRKEVSKHVALRPQERFIVSSEGHITDINTRKRSLYKQRHWENGHYMFQKKFSIKFPR